MANETMNDGMDPMKLHINADGKVMSLEELVERDDFEDFLLANYPREAAVLKQKGMDRRSFLKVMGASMALSGLGLAGCAARPPGEQILPYARMPEEIVPGIPLYFATSMVLGGYATGVLLETHEGRPTRLEGNPNHPASLGASSAIVQASLLDLYNPDRSINVRNNGQTSDMEAFSATLADALATAGSGEGVRILTEMVTSPTLASQIEAFLESYPDAVWYQYEPAARDNVVAGAQLAFGEDVNTVYRLENADVIVAVGGNFLADMPGSLRYAREFAARRRVRMGEDTSMNRLYAVESTPSITGSAADHAVNVPPSEVEAFIRALADALGVAGGEAASGSWNETFFNAVVEDLQANAGSSVIIPGDEQPASVHALAHAINAELGAVGSTVVYTEPVLASSAVAMDDLSSLVAEMNEGQVELLVMLGGNPVYSAPADLSFAEALAQVALSVHLSLYNDETSQAATWHLPQTHFVEEWSDARAFDSALSLVQPPIGPLYAVARSVHDVLAMMNGDERSNYEIVREFWESEFSGADFESYWRAALHNGVADESTLEEVSPSLADFAGELPALASGGGLELVFRTDPALWDGRFAMNSWLQELPDPVTSITWDNAALISPNTARELRISNEDLVEIAFDGRTVTLPVFTVLTQADNTITVSLGYGRGISAELDSGRNFNVNAIRTSTAPWVVNSVELNRTRADYPLAVARPDPMVDGVENVYVASLAKFMEDPEHVAGEHEPGASLLPGFVYDGNKWGMSIDLTACIGCNACMIGCQMENNIPTVGKDGVARSRDMSWIRIDRYYQAEGEGFRTSYQPVPCMHCEEAPCEQVCPVQATVHSNEGLNQMVYNRCVGTRYCSANCPYGVRRFNYLDYVDENPITEEWRNPNVTVRVEGVMEKCTYCVQRINRVRAEAKKADRPIADGEIVTACEAACPTQAIVFGNLNDDSAAVVAEKSQPHDYGLLAGHLNTKPRTTYLARLINPNEALYETEEE